jgi:hypothetical protein
VNGRSYTEFLYEYDAKSNNTLEIFFDENSKKYYEYKTANEYDVKGNVIKQTIMIIMTLIQVICLQYLLHQKLQYILMNIVAQNKVGSVTECVLILCSIFSPNICLYKAIVHIIFFRKTYRFSA